MCWRSILESFNPSKHYKRFQKVWYHSLIVNRDNFSELAFLPSNVTDRPQPILDETTPTNIDDDDSTSCASSLADIAELDADQDPDDHRTPSPSLLTNNFDQDRIKPRNLLSLSLEATSFAIIKKATTPYDVAIPSTSRITPDSSQPFTNLVSTKDFQLIIKGPQNIRKGGRKYDRHRHARKKCSGGKEKQED